MLKSYLLFIILFLGFIVNAQQKLHYGNDALERGKYPKAIRLLTKAYNRRQTFEAASKLGRAYELIQDFSKSEEWYRKSVNMPQAQDSIYPYFANILRMNSKFDEAKMFYEMLDKPNDEKAVIWKEYIESCSRADTMLFQNTSAKVYTIANINDSASDFPSYARGKNLYFASSRRSTKPAYKIINPETDFPYYSVYHAEVRKNEAKEIKNVLTDKEYSSHEGPVALSRDYIAYLTVNSNLSERRLINRRLDIQIGKVNSSSDKITELVPFPYNTIEYSEGQAYLSNDGKRLYFVSNGPLSLGGTDIFMCLKKGEEWGEPVNLGPGINTKHNEFFPYERNANELYFSSTKPSGFGGMDIYGSQKKGGVWENGYQLPAPINSSRDDFALVFADSVSGYFASNREGGQGKDDIYGFVLPKNLFPKDFVDSLLVLNPPKIKENPTKQVEDKTNIADKQVKDDLEEKSLKIDNLKLKNIPNDTLFTLSGTVDQLMDTSKLRDKSSVLVSIIDTNGTQRKTLTNKEGEFKFTKVDDQPYIIRAKKDDYFTSSVEVDVSAPNKVEVLSTQIILENIEYAFNSAQLNPIAKSQLDRIAKVMKEKANYNIELSSYTDARGTDEYNLALSKRRASSVRTYLISKGIKATRIVSKGYGEANLIVKNATTEPQHQLNRRTEFQWIIAN